MVLVVVLVSALGIVRVGGVIGGAASVISPASISPVLTATRLVALVLPPSLPTPPGTLLPPFRSERLTLLANPTFPPSLTLLPLLGTIATPLVEAVAGVVAVLVAASTASMAALMGP